MNRSSKRTLFAALFALALLACGKKKTSTVETIQASCDAPASSPHLCQDISGAGEADLSWAATQCVAGNGAWSTTSPTTPCPTADRIGSCHYVLAPSVSGHPGAITVDERYFGAADATMLSLSCASEGGAWTAG